MSQNLEICKPWSGVSEILLFLAGIGIRMILLDKDTKEQMEGRKLPTWAVILSLIRYISYNIVTILVLLV